MSFASLLSSSATSIGVILAAMAAAALVETAIPLRARVRWNTTHLAPNLTLTFTALAMNVLFSAGLVPALLWCETHGAGLLQHAPLPPLAHVAVVVLGLDLASYATHVAMHKSPRLWRFHSVHHSDPAVDVTTTVRQHPGDTLIRGAAMAGAALLLGASPGALAIYRMWSALNGLLEHANIRVPLRLDRLLSLAVVTPNLHKVHHSRIASETDTNYGNIFALFDRLFSTCTPSPRGVAVAYGLDGFDAPAEQTTARLLTLPFRHGATAGGAAGAADLS